MASDREGESFSAAHRSTARMRLSGILDAVKLVDPVAGRPRFFGLADIVPVIPKVRAGVLPPDMELDRVAPGDCLWTRVPRSAKGSL